MRKLGASVRSRFDSAPYVQDDFAEDEKPIDPSAVVDPSAAAVDPDNKNFIPANKDELKIAVQTLLSDIDNLEIPKAYQLIKKSILKMREEQTMEKKPNIEEAVRLQIRRMLTEFWAKQDGKMVWKGAGPAPALAKGAEIEKFSTSDAGYQAGLKRLKTSWTPEREGRHDDSDADAVLKAIASRVKPDDPVGSIKRAARYLKDNVPGDVASNLNAVISALAEFNSDAASKMKSALSSNPNLLPKSAQTGEVARDKIAKELGLKHGTNVRSLEQVALEKLKRVAEPSAEEGFSLTDNASIAVMSAMQDFIEIISGPAKGLFSDDDIQLFKSNPEMATELATFRVFLDPYLDQFVQDPEDPGARASAKSAGTQALKKELKTAMKGKGGSELEYSMKSK